MDLRVRRAWLPTILAVMLLLLLGWHAVPAHAGSIDPEMVAESVSEDGYYVDSSASYLTSDADLDKLRAAIDGAGRAGVVVLPAGVSAQPVISRLLNEPNQRATYVVLSGSRLQAVSNNIPSAKVNGLVARARRAGDPQMEVLTFLDLLGGKHPASTVKKKEKSSAEPSTAASTGAVDPGVSTTPVAAAKKASGGGNGMLYSIIGVVVVLLLAAGGFVLWRRRQGASGGPGAPGAPGGHHGPAAPPVY